jgi:hypothetical protein
MVLEIRSRRELGETLTSLASAFGVGTSTVAHIIARDTWTHV